MINLRVFLLVLTTIWFSDIHGQKLIFSPEITLSNDEKLIPISEMWSKYINSYKEKDSDSIRHSLWHNGCNDIMKNIVSKNIFYKDGEQFTISIRSVPDNFYEINTIAQMHVIPGESPLVLKMYKVYAKEIDSQFKLFNYFDVTKHSLNYKSIDNIDFYSPKLKELDESAMKEAAKFVKDFKNLYEIDNSLKITCVIANSIDQCWSLLGVPYTVYRSEKDYSGFMTHSGILISTQANHIHEFVHAIMLPLYPDAPQLLHEGIATYYGGGAKKDYTYHIGNLKEHIKNNNIDFTGYDDLVKEIEGETFIQNTAGALIIEYTLKKYGHKKVLQLFEHSNNEDVFRELGVEKENINHWLYRLIEQHK